MTLRLPHTTTPQLLIPRGGMRSNSQDASVL